MKKGGGNLPFFKSQITGQTAMIDGVKITFYSHTILADLQALGTKTLQLVDINTGEVTPTITAIYNSLKIKASESGRVEIAGSLHKYWKGDNHSDFTHHELKDCITDLAQKFKFSPTEAEIHNIEFGVNVSPSFSPYQFCKRVIAFKGFEFSKLANYNKAPSIIGYEACPSNYRIKIYDKGRQYKIRGNTLRYEIAVKKMVALKGMDIKTLNDLYQIEPFIKLGAKLNGVFAELIINESVNHANLSPDHKRIYAECINPKSWGVMKPVTRLRRKAQYSHILKNHSTTNYRAEVAKLISDKWQQLLNE